MKKIFFNFLIGLMGGFAAYQLMHFIKQDQPKAYIVEKPLPASNPSVQLTDYTFTNQVNTKLDFTVAAENTVNSVVHISSEYSIKQPAIYDQFYQYFYGPNYRNYIRPQQSTGSGVIISPDGYIVTNNHVIDHAEKITVTLNNNKSYQAKIIGADPGTDIALLKIDAHDLQAIPIGNSDEVKVGEWVLAVGNPFNLNSTVTAGIVSAKSRNIHILEGNPDKNIFPIESFIQTDAAVNPGNSGGALVNIHGQLIGINTAIASNTGSYAGYSFAVPVNLMQKVVADLMKYGTVQRGFLGVNIRNIDQALANELNINDLKGVYVAGLVPNGAGEQAGIKEGDIIVAINETEVNSASHLQEQVARFRPGDELSVRIKRGKEEFIIPVTLKNSEGNTKLIKKDVAEIKNALGAILENPSTEELTRLKLNSGVKVSSIGTGKFKNAGIKPGFIITKVDNIPVKNPDELINYLKIKKGEGVLIEGYYPNGKREHYAIGL
jgi:Do/DeqQ family serine protease